MKTTFETGPLWGMRLFIICSVMGIWGCSPPNREVYSSFQSKREPFGESAVEPALEQPRREQVEKVKKVESVEKVKKSLSSSRQPTVIKNVWDVSAKQPPANVSPVQKEDRLSLISSLPTLLST
jgi:MoxR-like ATPase